MKKKVFLILSSLTLGGAERVFWLLSQYMDKTRYDVSMVLLDGTKAFYSPQLKGVRVIDLKTVRASRSFFKLSRLLISERPDAVFTTGGQINMLLAILSLVIRIPILIARPTNVAEQIRFASPRAKLFRYFGKPLYKRFNYMVFQSEEIRSSFIHSFPIDIHKAVLIPNPIVPVDIIRQSGLNGKKRIIVAARLEKQKGHKRLLEVLNTLPENYHLTIAGDGSMKSEIISQIKELKLEGRVEMLGMIKNIQETIAEHDLMVLSSFVEGFPNAALESLSVGVPVVSFRVGGISRLIREGFNGYVVEQDDLERYKKCIINAIEDEWDSHKIREDVFQRFSIYSVVKEYQKLIA